MKAENRRKEIAQYLLSEQKPVSGAELSAKFHVSRQIIVQDIAVMKAAGCDIVSTHYGYVMQKSPFAERVFKVRHTSKETEDELSLIVSLGGTVVDVHVWHKVYGKIEARLNISSASHVKKFMEGVRSGKSSELMHVTDGYHYHTVRADNEETLNGIESALRGKNYLAAGE
ncbi:MAG: transcription repressor NadR [Clostridia bacterium]|nr:transcription repressor NadR [Clostridia bacterium]